MIVINDKEYKDAEVAKWYEHLVNSEALLQGLRDSIADQIELMEVQIDGVQKRLDVAMMKEDSNR